MNNEQAQRVTEAKTITHRWKQEPSIRRMPVWNNVSVDSIVAYAVRDDGKLCQESEIIDVWGDDRDIPKIEEIKESLLSRLKTNLTTTITHSWKRGPRYRVFSDILNPIVDTVVVFAVRDDDAFFKETGTFDYDDGEEMKSLIKKLLLSLDEQLSDK